MVFDEVTGEWVPKWGYKGRNKAGEKDWIVEVDDRKEAERKEKGGAGAERQGDGRRERKEKVRRNERLQRANERKGRKGGRA
jgi:regulator of ribosome biosynthesis